jgi:hypothetical protein
VLLQLQQQWLPALRPVQPRWQKKRELQQQRKLVASWLLDVQPWQLDRKWDCSTRLLWRQRTLQLCQKEESDSSAADAKEKLSGAECVTIPPSLPFPLFCSSLLVPSPFPFLLLSSSLLSLPFVCSLSLSLSLALSPRSLSEFELGR